MGNNDSLQQHLSFAGDSAYVSTSKSKPQAALYAFGRSMDNNKVRYLYKMAGVSNSIDVTIRYNEPAVKRNQEIAVLGHIRPELIK